MSVLIIAEAGVNHNGSMLIAKQLVDAAVEAGVDIIKFQTFKTEKLVSKTAKKAEYQKKNIGDGNDSQYEMLKKLELSEENHKELIAYCQEKGIRFWSTAFDFESMDYLHSLRLGLWKIPSGEITNYPFIRKIANMLHDYDCSNYAYFMGSSDVQAAAIEVAPEISRCMGAESDMAEYTILKRAIYWKCQKLQFFKPYFNKEMIDQAHQNGIICNLFWSDDPQEARNVLEVGIDTILTNNYLQIAQVRDQFVKDMKK
jgi:glycerophosphoryl diester phosphodiesterase